MRYTVEFSDGTTEEVVVDEADAENEDHLAEMIAAKSSAPDEVEDFWREGDE